MDAATLLLLLAGITGAAFLLDLLFAGGGTTAGALSGMGAMLSHPAGQAMLLALLLILGLLLYGVLLK